MKGKMDLKKKLSKSRIGPLIVALAMLLISCRVWAAQEAVAPSLDDMASASFKMFGSLILVIGIILVIFYGIRRLKLTAGIQGPARMRVIGTLALAPKRSIALVEVCGELLLLGIGTDNVRLLSKLEKPEDLLSHEQEERGGGAGFLGILRGKRAQMDGGEQGD